MTSRTLASLLVFSTLGLLHCGDAALSDGHGEVAAAATVAEELFIPISNYETSRSKSAKVAKIKTKDGEDLVEIARCHQYEADSFASSEKWEVVVCRDGGREVIMNAAYGDDFKRFARLRSRDGREQTFLCAKVAEHEFSTEAYGGMTGHLCKPKSLDAAGRALFDAVDAEPTISEKPTRSVYLPTMWASARPEKWSDWSDKIATALPVGEYVGQGSTSAKKCKVKVTAKDQGLEVVIVGLDESGAEKRVQARVALSSSLTYGALLKHDVPQEVSSTARKASVLIASAETETRTDDYYSRNFRIVRFPDAPANADAGHTAVFIDDNYCQRLTPGLPAW